MNGLHGQVAVLHVDQARNLELFKYKRNMGANYALDYHRGTVTSTPVQSSNAELFGKTSAIKFLAVFLQSMNAKMYQEKLAKRFQST